MPTQPNVVNTPPDDALDTSGPRQALLLIIAFIAGFASWPLFWLAMSEPLL